MSFWGGFVEGFSKTGVGVIKSDEARTDNLVDDTVKIGVSKALEVREEVKKDKKRIRDELGMLTAQEFSLPVAASIVKSGMTSAMIKLRNNTKNRLGADQLWNGTTKFAQDSKLTVQDVVNKLSYQEPLDFGDLKVGTPKGSLLGALGLAPDVDTRIQEGIMSRVGKLDTGVDRSDIAILPGSIPLEAKKQFDTDTNLTMDQEILRLKKKKIQDSANFSDKDRLLLEELEKFKKDTFTKQLATGVDNITSAQLPINIKRLKELDKIIMGGEDKDGKAKTEFDKIMKEIKRIKGLDFANNLLNEIESGK
jgi:hypothetical protein